MNRDNEKNKLQILEEKSQHPSAVKTAAITQITVTRKTPIVSFSGRKKRKRFSLRRLIIPLLSLFLAFSLLTFYAEHLLASRFPELAESQAEKHLLETVNAAVEGMASDGLLSYESMVKTIRDEKGEVIYLEVDTAMLARAASLLVKRIDEALEESGRITLKVPLGGLGKWNLFSGVGVPVRVPIYPISSTEGRIYTVLEDCGINQTRHLIRVDISAKLHLVLTESVLEVKTELSLPLGERVLVGDVPEIYLDNIGAS